MATGEQAAATTTGARTEPGGGFSAFGGMVPTFSGEPDQKIVEFFETLEDIAQLTGWTPQQCLGIAKCKLAGIARDYARRDLRVKAIREYTEFKAALIKRFDKEPYTLRLQKFHTCMQTREEDVQTYAVRLQALAQETQIEQTGTAAEMAIVQRCQRRELDERLRVQFLSGLNPRIKRSVLSKDPSTFDEALQVAIREETIEQLTRPRTQIAGINQMEDTNNPPRTYFGNVTQRSRETSPSPNIEETLSQMNNRIARLEVRDQNPLRNPVTDRNRSPYRSNITNQTYRYPRPQNSARRVRFASNANRYPIHRNRQDRRNSNTWSIDRYRLSPRIGSRTLSNRTRTEILRGIGISRRWETNKIPKNKRSHYQECAHYNYVQESKKPNTFSPNPTPTVKGLVNDKPITLAIDTGARVSLISKSFLKGLMEIDPVYQIGELDLRSVTGHPIYNYGIYQFLFQLGPIVFNHPCYVVDADITAPFQGMIGRDIIESQRIIISLYQRKLILPGGREIPLFNFYYKTIPTLDSNRELTPRIKGNVKEIHEEGKRDINNNYIGSKNRDKLHNRKNPITTTSNYRRYVRMIRDYIIPPSSEIITTAQVQGRPVNIIGVVESDPMTQSGLIGTDVLVKTQRRGYVPIRLRNDKTQPIKLRKGEKVGTFVEAVEEEEEEIEPKPGCSSASKMLTEKEFGRLFNWSEIGKDKKKPLLALLYKYKHVFAAHDFDLGFCDQVQHEINTENNVPIYQPPYRIPYAQRENLDEIIDELLENDIIELSKSPWSAPALLVKKKDGTHRLVIDYRKINKITKMDPYPIPLVQEALSLMGNQAKYFTTLDTLSGFWQLGVKDREKTAFSTPSGHYQWKRMPMGLCNSPSSWQRCIDLVLGKLRGKCCLVYMDDILIFSNDFQSHLNRLELVLQRLAQAGIKLKPKKCHFLQKQIKFLGHEVSSEGIRPDPDKISCVEKFPVPQNEKDVRSFLGLTGYYRRHIDSYAQIAKPLTELLKQDVPFHWQEPHQTAFDKLKDILTTAPLLRSPDFNKPFILATDASKQAIGAILSQKQEDGEFPIAYASRTLRKPEQNYSATERECLAVIWAVKYFRPYLYGRKFTIITDHRPLRWLINVKDPSSRLARWNLALQEYNFDVVHKEGKRHTNADALSRIIIGSVEEFNPIYDKEQIGKEQRRDPQLVNIIQILSNEAKDPTLIPPNIIENYFLDEENVLYHRRKVQDRNETWNQLVIPKTFIRHILRIYHDVPTAGHLGSRKMKRKIETQFFWPGMYKDINNYCQSCPSCAIHKRPETKHQAPLQLFSRLEHVFERTAMDIIGPLPITTQGNKYILVFVDHYSRYAEAIALPDITTHTVAKALVTRIILKHSVPKQILTDRGTNFTSRMMREVCTLLKIEQLFTTAYHPACNGIVERFNKTLIDILANYVREDQRDWDEWIPYALFAYNTTVHASTNETPFFLLYGRDPTYPFDILTEPAIIKYDITENYASELQLRLRTAHETAQEYAAEAAKDRRDIHKKTNKPYTFFVGDRVFVNEVYIPPGLKRKFHPRWIGPFRIIEQTGPVNFKVENIKTKKNLTVHANRLKPAVARMEFELPLSKPITDQSQTRETKETTPSSEIDPWDEFIFNSLLIGEQTPLQEREEEVIEGERETVTPTQQPRTGIRGAPHVVTSRAAETSTSGDRPHPYALRSRGPVASEPWIPPTGTRRSRLPRLVRTPSPTID